MTNGSVLAVDLGASSGRVILGEVGPDRLELTELARFRNGPVQLPEGLYWDILGLYQDVLGGLRAARDQPDVRGVAVDSWAVDYGLLDASGRLLGNPVHYRDERSARGMRIVDALLPPAQQYALNGLQHIALNTVNQLAADGDRLACAHQALLIPDLIGYWLAGAAVTERTNASTTGLLDPLSGQWCDEISERLGLPTGLFPRLVDPGTVVGALSAAVSADTGLPELVQLSTVASHDTASAVVGVPARSPAFGYISLGTWGLVGVELEEPVLGNDSAAANFTNELGIEGTVRYLRNVVGLWLLQECLRDWALHQIPVDLSTVLAQAAALPTGGPTIDADSPSFVAPGCMPARIAAACREQGHEVPGQPAQFVRCIIDSLALSLTRGLRAASRLSGIEMEVVHMVGGGARNALLCQLTADAVGLPVVAGPVEATAIGNVVVQARTHGLVSGDRWDLRALVRGSQHLVTYRPRTTASAA